MLKIMEKIILLILILFKTITSLTTSATIINGKSIQIASKNYEFNHNTTDYHQNKTIADLVQQQTDAIKKIVSNHNNYQQQSRLEYPLITKYGIDEKTKIKQEYDKVSLDELKIRCQHLAQLIQQNNRHSDNRESSSSSSTTITTGTSTTYKPTKGFYITEATTAPSLTTITTTPIPSTTIFTTKKIIEQPIKLPQNIKLIKLEPVILQKTVLSDGRTIYYWHKSLPSAVHYHTQSSTGYLPQFHDRYDYQPLQLTSSPPLHAITTTTTSTTQKPTTTTSGGYDFRNFFPSFYSIGNSEQLSTSTSEKTTTTVNYNEKPSTEENEEIMYSHQLRFVVPVPYANPDNIDIKKPWDFDQFAYYPKQLQPETVNVQMPYIPTFHIIKALAIPNSNSNSNSNSNNNNNNSNNNNRNTNGATNNFENNFDTNDYGSS